MNRRAVVKPSPVAGAEDTISDGGSVIMRAVRSVISPILISAALVLALVPAVGAYCVKGTYASNPNPSYYCAFGAVISRFRAGRSSCGR